MTAIPTTGWYLENRIGNHKKFYTVLIAENGVVVTAWGRIGQAGQSKIQKFPSLKDAEALGKRQVYAKQTGGYSVIEDEFKFTITNDILNTACAQDSAPMLLRQFAQARTEPKFQGDSQVVMKHYEDFAGRAQALLNTAAERPFDEVYAEYEELEAAWKVLRDKHDEVAVTVSLTSQTLHQRLLSGSL